MKHGKQNLGLTVYDRITGFTGVITAHVTFITGCDQYCVQPPVKDGAYVEGRYIDVHRVYEIKADRVEIEVSENPDDNGPDITPQVK